MGIDLATWRARIGLNYYHMCRPLQTRWRSSGGRLCQPGVASWGVGEVMNDTPLVLKGCMTVVALSLILQYVVHSWSKLKGRGGGGKVRCHWRESTCRLRETLDGGGTLLLKAIVVVILLLLVIAGDVETNPGPEAPNLRVLLNELHPVYTSWFNIGLQLGIPYHKLECFKQMYLNPSELMREMLARWFMTAIDPRPSWEAVVVALRSPSVDAQHLAEQLESKYCTPIMTESNSPITSKTEKSEDTEGHTTSAAIHSANTSPPPMEAFQPVQKEAQLDTDNKPDGGFTERGISSSSSFPHLNLSELTHKQQHYRKERLWCQSEKINLEFQKLVSATIKSLNRQNVSPDKLLSHVMTLGSLKRVFEEPQVPALHHRFNELKAAKTIYESFLVLNDYFSFFNYHIIEHIIEELGTEEDKANLQKYKQDFYQYAERRIFECLPEFGPVLNGADHVDIFVKLDSQYDDYTVAELERFCHKLSDILDVSLGILCLCRVDKGCLQLTFQVPSFVQRRMFPLSREQERALAVMNVIKLLCGKYRFLKGEISQEGVDMKHQHDPDDDSGIGTFTDTKSTTFSEDCQDKEMKELDYELKVQGLVEPASSHKSWRGLELHLAVAMGQLEDVRLLVEEKNCKPLQKDPNGNTAFHMAALMGRMQVLKYFITEYNCNPAFPGPLGLTPLHLACQGGHLDMVKYLVIEQQVDPECEDEYGNSPLHRACASGSRPVVEFLTSELQNYASVPKLVNYLKNKWNSTPLHIAAINGHLDIVDLFISDQKYDPKIPGQNGVTLLHCAAQFGHLHIVKYLIDEQGCNPSCLDEEKYTPLHCAAQEGHMDVVRFLTMQKHCNPRSRNANNDTALHLAAVDGNLDIIRFFISNQNCDPNIPGGQHGAMPLHYAAENGHLKVVKYLIDEQGCDPSCLDRDKYTPLHCAAMQGHLDIVKFLTEEKHCDSNIPGQYDKTALHYAAEFGHLHIVKYLIDEQGCNPSCWDKDKDTPLHYAAKEGCMDVVKFLVVEKRCDPMCRNSNLNIPLHMAVVGGHLEIIKFFVEELKCPLYTTGALNMTPLKMAIRTSHSDIAQYLQKYTVIQIAIVSMKQLGFLK